MRDAHPSHIWTPGNWSCERCGCALGALAAVIVCAPCGESLQPADVPVDWFAINREASGE